MHEVENFCQFVGKKIQLLRNYGWVVELLCFSGLYRVFFYSAVADLRVGKPLLAQLLLPCIEKDTVEASAKSHIKYIYTLRCLQCMEKVLYACDELTGLIGAAALMRPSKSVQDMELSSLKMKFKDKKFAAGCSRDVIKEGAERLGWTLDEVMEKTILAMRSCETSINNELSRLCG